MSENLHNCGKIDWNCLDKTIIITYDKYEKRCKKRCNNPKALKYFSSNMFNVIKEFASTSKGTEINPFEWTNEYELFVSAGAQTSHLNALVCIYIELNLLMFNWTKYYDLWISNRCTIFDVCLGFSDYGHPSFLADMFTNIVHELIKIKKEDNMSVELVQQIRDYLDIVFKSLYSIVMIENNGKEINRRFTDDEIHLNTVWMFNFKCLHLT